MYIYYIIFCISSVVYSQALHAEEIYQDIRPTDYPYLGN